MKIFRKEMFLFNLATETCVSLTKDALSDCMNVGAAHTREYCEREMFLIPLLQYVANPVDAPNVLVQLYHFFFFFAKTVRKAHNSEQKTDAFVPIESHIIRTVKISLES